MNTSKYLKKLLELIDEMSEDKPNLQSTEKQLLSVLKMLVAFYHFYMMDDLWTHLVSLRVLVVRPLIDDGLMLAAMKIEAEEKEIAAAEAAASIDQRIEKILEK